MKIFVLTLFLYFSLFAASIIYAATTGTSGTESNSSSTSNTTLNANYPAPIGSYKEITVNTQTNSNVDCTNPKNAGLLFMNTNTKTLELCATGQNNPVPPGTCFNRFWNAGAGPCSNTPPNGCPAGFTQAISAGSNMVDSFATDASHTVCSTVCCTSGSPTLPTS